MKILVCDDIPARCEEVVASILEAGQPTPAVLVEKALTTELERFFRNIRIWMDQPSSYGPGDESPFDGADIVIIDNNLAHLEVTGARLTAESIAGYIRAFTAAPYIISLNKNPDVDFDLRYLVGDHSTRADLALNTEHLANSALWTGNPEDAKDGFLPWYWPRLATVAARGRQQIDFVEQNLDNPVVDVFGFDEAAIDFLSLHARGALSPAAAPDGQTDTHSIRFDELTFRDVFIGKDRSLPFKAERQSISAEEEKGNPALRKVITRVVAADIELWFRRDILGPQEPLVDIPHLLMRLPFLLGDRAKDINEWNKTLSTETPENGMEQELYDGHLAKTRFEHDIWVPGPCFWWPKLKADEKLNEFFFEAKEGDWADAVFCEDRSKFLERSANDGEGPTEFPAEFEGSWGRRYVARVNGKQYAPRSRLAV
jgi:hypothetical protein